MRINRTKKIDNRPPFVNSAASVKIQREREKREMIEQKKLARKAPTGNKDTFNKACFLQASL